MGFRELQRDVHANAVAKGFWPPERTEAESIALIHSELSELLETYREDTAHLPCAKDPEMTNEEEEMADVVIRMMDLAQRRGVDLLAAVYRKHEVNLSRSHKHGKKF